MTPNGVASTRTIERNIGETIEQTPIDSSIYADTQLFIEKESTLTWQQVNESLSAKSLEADLEDNSRSNINRKQQSRAR